MDHQATQEEPTPRNTVTLSLDGDNAQCLESYRRAIGDFRAWNRSKGIRVDVSGIYGGQREVYTTPASGTFYFVVKYAGRKLTFVIMGRSGWLVGFYGQNGTHQLMLDDQDIPYMNCKHCNILSFKGNHRYISNGDPGSTKIGLHSIRTAFLILWAYLEQNPEPHQLRRAIGRFVVFLCESPKNQAIFYRICRSYSDPSISRLDAENGLEMQLGDCCQNWSKLSNQGMIDIDLRSGNGDEEVPQFDNYGISMIATAEDVLRVIRILHRDGCNQGVFSHEPIPAPPLQWEPIDLGEVDSSEDEAVTISDNDDSDDEYRRRGGRKKEKKYDKRRKTPQKVIQYISEKRRGSGGEPINFPDHLIGTWTVDAVKKTEEVLDLSQFQNIADVGVRSILKAVPNLLELDPSYCCPVVTPIVRNFQKLPKLQDLDDEGLKTLARCTKLPSLKIAICLKISDKGLTHVGRSCPKLGDIDLYGCGGLIDDENIQIVQGCLMLKSIDLSYFTETTHLSLIPLSKCVKLNTLEIHGCPRASSIGLSEIAMLYRLLSKFGIGTKEFFKINGGGMFYLSQFSDSLRQVLDLSQFQNITRVGIPSILKVVPNLLELDPSYCCPVVTPIVRSFQKLPELQDLDDEGLKALARCTKLPSLKIGICLKISDKGLTHVGRSCPKFRDIDLCGGLIDDEIIQIVQGCLMLKSIDLSYFTETADLSLIPLSKCVKLNTLEIHGCPRASSIGLSEIAMLYRLLSNFVIGTKEFFKINGGGMFYLSQFSDSLRQNMTNARLVSELHEAFKSMISHMIENIEARSFPFPWMNELFKMLGMSKCQNATYVGISSRVKSISNLMELNISYCCPLC